MPTTALSHARRKQILATVPGLKDDVSPTVLAFLAFRAAGLTCKDAYLLAKPGVKDDSAERYGSRLGRMHAQHLATLRSNPDLMHALLSDLACLTVMRDGQSRYADRLKAAELTDKKLNRYSPDTQVVNLFTDAESLGQMFSGPPALRVPEEDEQDEGAE